MIAIGEKAPDFCLLNQGNKEVCLSDYLGRWVVIYLNPKSQKNACSIETLLLGRYLDYLNPNGLVVFGVARYEVAPKRGTKIDNSSVNLLNDKHNRVTVKYQGHENSRQVLLIDPHGKVIRTWQGRNELANAQKVVAEIFHTIQDKKEMYIITN